MNTSTTHHLSRRHLTYMGLIGAVPFFLTACSPVVLPSSDELTGLLGHGDICGLPSVTASTNFFLLLAVGVLTGLSHCVGMCGPLVTTYAVRRRAAGGDAVTALVFYQMGRLTTYMLLGALMGAVGSVIRVNIIGSGWQGNLSIVIGLLMLLTGLSLWGVLPWMRRLESAGFARRVSGWMRTFMTSNHPAAPFALGATNGLLPCGPVYALVLIAATTGDSLRAATIMFAFGLGTLPAMLGVGFIASRLTLGVRSNLYRFAAVLVILVGLQLMLRGLAVGGVVPHTAVAGVTLW